MGPRSLSIIRHLILFLSILAALTIPHPLLHPSSLSCCLHPPTTISSMADTSRSKAVPGRAASTQLSLYTRRAGSLHHIAPLALAAGK